MVKDGHLGGFVAGGDERCFYPEMWDKLIKDFKIKSVVDVGCGEGYSCKYFFDKGLEVLAVDGSELVREKAVFPLINIHDYTKGKYELVKEFDLAWCCEFVEHVEAEFIDNFMATFKGCKVIVMTHALPGQGGYHHVNEQDDAYWIIEMEKAGFIYDLVKTLEYRALAHDYFAISGMVFVKGV